MSTPKTVKDVVLWMIGQIEKDGVLYQNVAVYDILDIFGEDFAYINENGNYAIDKAVLKEFRKLTANTVVWERGERAWRKREEYDEPTRSQE